MDGRCELEGCPEALFLCGQDCVDLATDAEHCRSCGTRCADAWPVDLEEFGITFAASGMTPTCEDGRCGFACPGGPTDPNELLNRNINHCGACGRACGPVPDNANYVDCYFGQCICDVAGRRGFDCNGFCEVPGDNCGRACCPRLQSEAGGQVGNANLNYQYRLTLPERNLVRVVGTFQNCRVTNVEMVLYERIGSLETIERRQNIPCNFHFERWLDPGDYGLFVERAWQEGVPYAYTVEVGRPVPILVAPGEQLFFSEGLVASATFTLPQAGRWEVEIIQPPGSGGICNRQVNGPEFLHAATGQPALAELIARECDGFRGRVRWTDQLEAGDYQVIFRSVHTPGNWRLSVQPAR